MPRLSDVENEFKLDRSVEASGFSAEDERMLLEVVFREKNAVSSQLEQRYRDTTEYFGLWAHQIKTPIAAMRLVLQEQEETPAGRELAAQLQAVEQRQQDIRRRLQEVNDTFPEDYLRVEVMDFIQQELQTGRARNINQAVVHYEASQATSV